LGGDELADYAEGEGTAGFELESEAGQDPRRDLFRLLAARDRPILSLRRSGISLEDAFIRLTAGDHAALSAIAGIGGGDIDTAGPDADSAGNAAGADVDAAGPDADNAADAAGPDEGDAGADEPDTNEGAER
jgi:hypothetical protein